MNRLFEANNVIEGLADMVEKDNHILPKYGILPIDCWEGGEEAHLVHSITYRKQELHQTFKLCSRQKNLLTDIPALQRAYSRSKLANFHKKLETQAFFIRITWISLSLLLLPFLLYHLPSYASEVQKTLVTTFASLGVFGAGWLSLLLVSSRTIPYCNPLLSHILQKDQTFHYGLSKANNTDRLKDFHCVRSKYPPDSLIVYTVERAITPTMDIIPLNQGNTIAVAVINQQSGGLDNLATYSLKEKTMPSNPTGTLRPMEILDF